MHGRKPAAAVAAAVRWLGLSSCSAELRGSKGACLWVHILFPHGLHVQHPPGRMELPTWEGLCVPCLRSCLQLGTGSALALCSWKNPGMSKKGCILS